MKINSLKLWSHCRSKHKRLLGTCTKHGEYTYTITLNNLGISIWQDIKILKNPIISYTYNGVKYSQNQTYTINNTNITVENFRFYFKPITYNRYLFVSYGNYIFDLYKVEIIATNNTIHTLWSKTPDDLSNYTVTNETTIELPSDIEFKEGKTAHKNTQISVNSANKLSEARLEYRVQNADGTWTDATPVITVKNPQFLKQDTYIFGKAPLKNISVSTNSTIQYRVVGTDEDGINEYTIKSETLPFKPKKGLK